MRRVLLICYYFPPSGGPGVQRALKFTKYLPEFGWRPTVLTVRPEEAAYPNLDPALEREVPPEARILRTRSWDPYALYARLLGKEKEETVGVGFVGESELTWKQRLARWIRANVFLPDARVGWVPFAVARAEAYLRAQPCEVVVTTGPPHSSHLIGWYLSRRFNLPWVVDLRDPWTEIDFAAMLPTTVLARRIDEALERAVLARASAVTIITPVWKDALAGRVPRAYEVIRNGFDPADFEGPPAALESDFVVAYMGNMNEARNPIALWQALRLLDASSRMRRLRVRLIGNVDPVVLASARAYGVDELVEVRAYRPHDEVVRAMQGSALLLLVVNRVAGMEGIVPGKLYEYLASGRPVLGIGPTHGDAACIIAESHAGRMFEFDDIRGVANFLERHYRSWEAGEPERGAEKEAAAVFSRREQTGMLADLLTRVAGSRRVPGDPERREG